jgi:hypothetical protein
MRDMTVAALISLVGMNGCAPTAQELFDEAWPVYERKVDLSRSGRGKDEFAEKCRYAIQRFERGEIRGLETLEKAVEIAGRKKQAQDARPGPPPDAMFDTQTAAAAERPVRTFSFLQLLTEEVEYQPDYIEPSFAGPGNFVLIAGPPKAQKSFLLQEMLVACATGSPFLGGTFTVPKPLRVFYLQAEMNDKLLRKRAKEMTMLTAGQKQQLGTNFRVSDRFHFILNEDGVRKTIDLIKADFPDAPPDIIALDPLANVFDGENENDNAQLMRFLTGRIEVVRQAVNPMACIVLVHHATKKTAEDMARDPFVAIRGASALRGYYDSAIVIFRENEESKGRKIHFELRGGDSPEPLVMELAAGRFQKVEKEAGITKSVARQMLTVIGEAWSDERPLSPYPHARKEGRFVVFNLCRQFAADPKAVQFLVDQWLANGVVTLRDRVSRGRPAGLQVTGSID